MDSGTGEERRGLTFRDLRNAILFATLIFLIVIFVHDVVNVILLFSIVLLIVMVLSPIVTWINHLKLPRWLGGKNVPRWAGTLAVTILFLGFLGLFFYYVGPTATRQFGQFVAMAPRLITTLNDWIANISSRFGVSSAPAINISTLAAFVEPLVGGVATLTTTLIDIIAGAVAIFITTIYALINPRPLVNGFLNAINPEYRERAAAAGQVVGIQVLAWAKGTAFAMFTIFVLSYVALLLLGIPQALLFAVIAGVLEIIPVIGPILGGALPTLTALAIDPIRALWVVLVFIAIQQFENHVLIPLVMSRQVRLHPVTVIVFVFVMGVLYGIVGIFLATPTAVVAAVLYEELYLCEYRKRCRESPEAHEEVLRQIEEAKEAGRETAQEREQAAREAHDEEQQRDREAEGLD